MNSSHTQLQSANCSYVWLQFQKMALRPNYNRLWLKLDLNLSHVELWSELKPAIVELVLRCTTFADCSDFVAINEFYGTNAIAHSDKNENEPYIIKAESYTMNSLNPSISSLTALAFLNAPHCMYLLCAICSCSIPFLAFLFSIK